MQPTGNRHQAVTDLLEDEHFGALLHTFAERGVTQGQFKLLPMPAGYGVEETWGILSAIRRSQAIHYRDISSMRGEPISQWFTATHSIESKLRDLAQRTGSGSQLEEALRERQGRRFILNSLIDETVATLGCDGLSIDYESARGVISGKRPPANSVERLAGNTHALLLSLLDDEQPLITPELIESMYRALTAGIDVDSLRSGVPWGLEWPEDPIPRDQAIEEICAMASGELVDPAEHIIITSQRLICKFWKTAPYPNCNYVMGSLLSRLHMKQNGFPVFVYIPSSSMTLAWKYGNYTSEGIYPYGESGNITGIEWDWTPYWESCLRLIQNELDKLERSVFSLKAQDDDLLERLQEDQTFNHRQRNVLRQAVLVPETGFKIQTHRAAYGLAYSTARQDLVSLVERGLLEMHYESKAQVFVARYDMKRVLAKRYGLG